MKNHNIIVVIAAMGLFCAAKPVLAQGTAFTYQGRLNDGANPAAGAYDLRFTVYDSTNLPGVVIAGPLTNSATALSNGLFAVTLDFGAGVFTGPSRWLEIGVRTNGGSTFATLDPRQPLTPSPYAIMASSASNLLGTLPAAQLSGTIPSANLSGSYGNAVSFNNGADSFNGTFVGQFFGSSFFGGSFNGNFFGDGGGVFNLNASQLASGTVPDARLAGNLARTNQVWLLNGNAGTTPGANFLGTADNQPVEIKVNGQRALRLEPANFSSVNVVGGASVNGVAPGVSGATIAGGGAGSYGGPASNSVAANFGVIGGGLVNEIDPAADHATIAGGQENWIQPGAQGSFIGGGEANQIQTNTLYAVLNGGLNNTIGNAATFSVIAGGAGNFIGTSNNNATISGGYYNSILDNTSGFVSGGVIGGGIFNHLFTNVNDSTIGGGNSCVIGPFVNGATIAGGYINQIRTNSDYATIGGGVQNTILANADYATIPGGWFNTATNQAFAAGTHAKAVHSGTFVWSDTSILDFTSTGTNQFLIRASGGVGIGTNNPQSALHVSGTITADALRAPGAGINTGTFAFTHRAVATNTSGNVTTLINPLTDNDPNAIVVVTHNWTADTNSVTKYTSEPVGVFYNSGHWAIFNESAAAMALGRAFNVLVIKP